MNLLALLFSLILILTYSFYASWDRQSASNRLRTTYLSHQKIDRKILNSFQSEVYKNFDRVRLKTPIPDDEEIFEEETTITQPRKPDFNHECAKLNLWPLIQEGRENHQALYELAAKLLRTFYSSLISEKHFEYHLLDALLEAAKTSPQAPLLALEKVALKNHQRIYYKMLKGTKTWDLTAQLGYPPLLDYIKATPAKDKICLFHAHPDIFSLLFDSPALYPIIHQQGGPALTPELIDTFYTETHLTSPSPDLLALLEFGHPEHPEHKKTLIAHDKQLSLRRTIYIK